MKKAFSLFALTLITLSLSACSKNEGSRTDLEHPDEKTLSEPVAIDAGTYEVAIGCADQTKAPTLPEVLMSYKFSDDLTYVETIKSLDKDCKDNCVVTSDGTYTATKTKFIFTQKIPAAKDGSVAAVVTENQEFSVLDYLTEKGQIVLMNESPDNACGGRMIWTLTKQPVLQ